MVAAPMINVTPLLIVACFVVAGGLAWWFTTGSPAARERDDTERLVRRVNGDHEMAERLVARELQRDPSLSRHHAVRDALQRLARDRR